MKLCGCFLWVAKVTVCCLVTMVTSEAVGVDTSTVKTDVDHTSRTIDVVMPGVSTKQDDEYMCTAVKAPDKESYITSFEAVAEQNFAHHIMMYGCDHLGSNDAVWPCEMGVCPGSSDVMFAWAMHAEPTILPKDIGFEVGGNKVKYIVLQVHYKMKVTAKDHSGIRITLTESRPKYLAGIVTMAASGMNSIPPHKERYNIDISCKFESEGPIYPFAFRVHAHSMATVISGYQVNGSWHLLKKGNPQWPQAFYPATEKFKIKPNDFLVARCTYKSLDKSKSVRIGGAHTDEMCNFYIMFYHEPGIGHSSYTCVDNQSPDVARNIPVGADVPPPHNSLLEDIAHGHHTGIHEVAGWPSEAPELGQVAGIATDSDGNVHVFHRGSRKWDSDTFDLNNVFKHKTDGPIKENTILTFDHSGKLINQWGADMFYLPHGLHIDEKGNIWITDVAMQQVMRFPAGTHEADLVLGEQFVPGRGPEHFCQPSDVATLRNGQFYISDGYCNHRIVKFSADGKFMQEWGEPSSSKAVDGFPPPGSFMLPHSLSVLEDRDLLCVADRLNSRIQCFDLNGNFLRQMHSPDITGQVYAVTMCPATGTMYAINGENNYDKINIGGFTFSPVTGQLAGTWGPTSGTMKRPHDIAVSSDGESIFVSEIGPNRIWKFSNAKDAGIHQSVKKNGRPETVDNDSGENNENILQRAEKDHFGASLIIGGLLIVPVLIIVLATLFIRLKKRGKLDVFLGSHSRNRRLNLGMLLSRGRHQFSPLSTDDKDPELDHLNSDSEVEEYSVTENFTSA